MSDPGRPSYEELLARVVAAESVISAQTVTIQDLSRVNQVQAAALSAAQAELAVLRRQAGRDSGSSSKPPSTDGLGARAAKDAKKREQRERRKAEQEAKSATAGASRGKRVRGGQPGHAGTNLPPSAHPDEVIDVEPSQCSGCAGVLDPATAGPPRVSRRVQVFDIPLVVRRCTEYRMITRQCPCCAARTTAGLPAVVPAGVAGGTCYGPNLRAMTAFLGSTEVVGLQRAASIIDALVGVQVSTGFISRCVQRAADALNAAGFEAALKAALRAAGVLGTDESPVRVADMTATTSNDGSSKDSSGAMSGASNPHVFTVRTMHAGTHVGAGPPLPDLIWCGAGPNRRGATIDSFGILPGYGGVLVRDDYGGYLKYEDNLQAVQQCVAHLRRYLADVFLHGIDQEAWCRQADQALTEAITLVRRARAEGMHAPDAALTAKLAQLRKEYDWATALGRSVNLSRPWARGGAHPGLVLAKRLAAKADQVWLFTHRFDVPATNNASESAIRGVKVNQKISGTWRTLDTLKTSMLLRSYLATTASHGIQAITAIRDALASNPWMPPLPA